MFWGLCIDEGFGFLLSRVGQAQYTKGGGVEDSYMWWWECILVLLQRLTHYLAYPTTSSIPCETKLIAIMPLSLALWHGLLRLNSRWPWHNHYWSPHMQHFKPHSKSTYQTWHEECLNVGLPTPSRTLQSFWLLECKLSYMYNRLGGGLSIWLGHQLFKL